MRKLGFIIGALLVNLLLVSNTMAKAVDEVADQYVRLVLALGQHDPAFVDAYYGPKEWQAQANQKEIPLKHIVIAAKNLQDVLAAQKPATDIDKLRVHYLNAQLGAVSARALMKLGRVKYDFDQESLALYNTKAPKRSLKSFQPTLDKLSDLLPGDTPLSQRVAEFNQGFIIPKDKLELVFNKAIEECRRRTLPFVELPENENFSLEFVTDKPWSGYNWYEGQNQSLIQVNVELPIRISRAVDLGCHEGYPGHHTYNALLEKNLYRQRGWVEFSIYALFSPQSLIAEGSANYGIEMAFPGDEKLAFEKKVLYPLAGLDAEQADKFQQVNKLAAELNYAGNEVARLYRSGEVNAEKAAQLLEEYALMSPAKAEQRVKFIDTYGAYVINYNWGKDMVKNWVEAGPDQSEKGRWRRFSQLLSSPRLPSTLSD